ncbi:hypothetical protein BWQ96_10152 [Gracilariopsis chorda]|uniref:Uncharacterized protein n=1 Tax=Gracilariopsis chorda TaxID=448386 RepID=A0A2V3IDI3_9FLOR|nr:hypothetical protein BWQ96_10152 [Gracilariopsis chorda]|eukprot:PXF40136.1 hypothetical protein BWQ96_10152 [Gracilariopsis chorda]
MLILVFNQLHELGVFVFAERGPGNGPVLEQVACEFVLAKVVEDWATFNDGFLTILSLQKLQLDKNMFTESD